MIDLDLVVKTVQAQIIYQCPKDTRNLVGTVRSYTMPDYSVIIIGGSTAKYMPFTTEPWVSPRWHGKKNPNEGWWKRATDDGLNAFDGSDFEWHEVEND